MKKTCTKCGVKKVLSLFKRDNAKKNCSSQPCRECGKKARLQRYYKRHEHFLEMRKKYFQKHKEEHYARTLKNHELYPEKNKARIMVRDAVKSGKLQKLPCEICETTIKVHGHHPDYSKPLEVVWLCVKHHGERHRTRTYGLLLTEAITTLEAKK